MRLEIPDDVGDRIRQARALAGTGDIPGSIAAYRRLLDEVGDEPVQAVAVLHMWAVVVDDPAEKLAMNEDALRRADAAPGFPPPLRASLLANVGYSHRELGDDDAARAWYLQARAAAAGLDNDDYGSFVRAGIEQQLAILDG